MTNKEAAEILREIAQQNLPTVNGLPFTEIKKALILGADALDAVDPFDVARQKSLDEIGGIADRLHDLIMNGGV